MVMVIYTMIEQSKEEQQGIIPKSLPFRIGDTFFTFSPKGSQYPEMVDGKATGSMITRQKATLKALPLGAKREFYLNAATIRDVATLFQTKNFQEIYSIAVPEIPEDSEI